MFLETNGVVEVYILKVHCVCMCPQRKYYTKQHSKDSKNTLHKELLL